MKPFAKNFWRMSGQAGGGIVEIGGADAQRHAENAGGVERLPAGVLPGHGDAAQ
jgi:23S rRNA A2030 N6-methylase RlmJ